MKIAIRCLIRGRVQGVCFRASTRREAQRLGVTGWAHNLADGGVEVFACGEASRVAQLRSWLQHGPQRAEVTAADCETVATEAFPDDFTVG